MIKNTIHITLEKDSEAAKLFKKYLDWKDVIRREIYAIDFTNKTLEKWANQVDSLYKKYQNAKSKE